MRRILSILLCTILTTLDIKGSLDFNNAAIYKENIGLFVQLDNSIIGKILSCYLEDIPYVEYKAIKNSETSIEACKIPSIAAVEKICLLVNLVISSKYFSLLLDQYKLRPYVCFDRTIFNNDDTEPLDVHNNLNSNKYCNLNSFDFKKLPGSARPLAKISLIAENEYTIDFSFDCKTVPKISGFGQKDCLLTRWKTNITFNPKSEIYRLLCTHLSFNKNSPHSFESFRGPGSCRRFDFERIKNLINDINKEKNKANHYNLFIKHFCKTLPIEVQGTCLEYLFKTKKYPNHQSYTTETIFPSFLFIKKQTISISVPNPLEQLSLTAILPKINNIDKLNTNCCLFLVLNKNISTLSKSIRLLQDTQDVKKILKIVERFIYVTSILKKFLKNMMYKNNHISLEIHNIIVRFINQLKKAKITFTNTLRNTFFCPQKDFALQWSAQETCNTLKYLDKKNIFKGSTQDDIQKALYNIITIIKVITHYLIVFLDTKENVCEKADSICLNSSNTNDPVPPSRYLIALYIQKELYKKIVKKTREEYNTGLDYDHAAWTAKWGNIKEFYVLSNIFENILTKPFDLSSFLDNFKKYSRIYIHGKDIEYYNTMKKVSYKQLYQRIYHENSRSKPTNNIKELQELYAGLDSLRKNTKIMNQKNPSFSTKNLSTSKYQNNGFKKNVSRLFNEILYSISLNNYTFSLFIIVLYLGFFLGNLFYFNYAK